MGRSTTNLHFFGLIYQYIHMYLAIRSIMCIQCTRCSTVFACRHNPWIDPYTALEPKLSKDARNCPANFNFVANCARCYK